MALLCALPVRVPGAETELEGQGEREWGLRAEEEAEPVALRLGARELLTALLPVRAAAVRVAAASVAVALGLREGLPDTEGLLEGLLLPGLLAEGLPVGALRLPVPWLLAEGLPEGALREGLGWAEWEGEGLAVPAPAPAASAPASTVPVTVRVSVAAGWEVRLTVAEAAEVGEVVAWALLAEAGGEAVAQPEGLPGAPEEEGASLAVGAGLPLAPSLVAVATPPLPLAL